MNSLSAGKTGKKKKKKVVNKTEADEVKQLPDEVINHRPGEQPG